jgi:hypothetical protein
VKQCISCRTNGVIKGGLVKLSRVHVGGGHNKGVYKQEKGIHCENDDLEGERRLYSSQRAAFSHEVANSRLTLFNQSFILLADHSCPADERTPAETVQRMNLYSFDIPVGSARTTKSTHFARTNMSVKAAIGRTDFVGSIAI